MSILDRFSLDGKVAIVTGASSGLGAAAAEAMAEAGAAVVIAARREDRLESLKDHLLARDRRAVAVAADVTDPAQCQAVVAKAQEEFGRVDCVLNAAGLASAVPATRETPEEFRSLFQVNLDAAYWMAQAGAKAMVEGGSIINVSSVLAYVSSGLPQAAYSASKAGVLGLTRDLASQWSGRKRIRVNAIVPGYFETEMTAAYDERYATDLIGHIPIGRAGHSEEFAAAAVFLASEASGYITGIAMPVDGGYLVAG